MAKKRAKGGNVTTASAAAKVDIADKCALIAIPVPNAKAKPNVFKATDINEAITNLNVAFKVKQKKLDGSTVREEVHIRSLEDFEESNISLRSSTLREQQQQMTFLHDFQSEIKSNDALKEELKTMLESKNKEKLIAFLKGWIKQFKNPDPQLQQLLQSNFSNH